MGRESVVLVTGGAGYIGSHLIYQLQESGIACVAVDDLSTGWEGSVPPGVPLFIGDFADTVLLRRVFAKYRIDAVIHLAAKSVVPDSLRQPLEYYETNFVKTHQLLSFCGAQGVTRFLFSSTAAVYGIPARIPVNEDSPTEPISPYGRSKLMVENFLRDLEISRSWGHDFRFIALRYFNVAGARLDSLIGQRTPNASHLVKVACEAACGKRDSVTVFGNDYPTPDGTALRDYIHVEDLASAHLLALAYLRAGGQSQILNCGYGRAFSVNEILSSVQRMSGVRFRVNQAERRAGDPAASCADTQRIRTVLDWHPRYDDIDVICGSAFKWEAKSALAPKGAGACSRTA